MPHLLRGRSLLLAVGALCSPALSATAGTCAEEAADDEQVRSVQSTLLQHRLNRTVADLSKGQGGSAVAGMDLPKSLAWFHVPRTGTSFAYSLVTHNCNWDDIGKDWSNDVPTVGQVKTHCAGIYLPKVCDDSDLNWVWCAEASIGGDSYSRAEGRLAGMFRDPAVRIVSDWAFVCREAAHCSEALPIYAARHEGCVTGMLLRDEDANHCTAFPEPTAEEFALAKVRVRTGFAFIGLTDEWNLSICLFNAMFATPCRASQFQNFAAHVGDAYNTSKLDGWVDRFDTELWEIAQGIFSRNLISYGVSDETCQPCSD